MSSEIGFVILKLTAYLKYKTRWLHMGIPIKKRECYPSQTIPKIKEDRILLNASYVAQ